jgi:hypothetical protein
MAFSGDVITQVGHTGRVQIHRGKLKGAQNCYSAWLPRVSICSSKRSSRCRRFACTCAAVCGPCRSRQRLTSKDSHDKAPLCPPQGTAWRCNCRHRGPTSASSSATGTCHVVPGRTARRALGSRHGARNVYRRHAPTTRARPQGADSAPCTGSCTHTGRLINGRPRTHLRSNLVHPPKSYDRRGRVRESVIVDTVSLIILHAW